MIRNRSSSLERALELMAKYELSPTDAKFLAEFSKCREEHLNKKGINYCNCIKLTLKYHHEAEIDAKKKNIKRQPKFIHGADRFLFEFPFTISGK